MPVTNTTDSATNSLHDIKPPVEIPSGWEWLWWTLGALAVGTLIWLAWSYWRKRQAPVAAPPLPAHIRAKQRLEEALALISQPKPFCTAVSDAVRFYLEERFDFRAPDRTTEEFLHELRGTDRLLPDQKESLGEFLQGCNLVKFARYEPREAELRDLHDSALRLIEETQLPDVAAAPTAAATIQPVGTATSAEPRGEPFTVKERLIGLFLALCLIGMGAATWLWPHLHLVPDAGSDGTFGRGGRRVIGLLRIIEFVWSRPLGTALAIVGLFVLWGVFTRKHKQPEVPA